MSTCHLTIWTTRLKASSSPNPVEAEQGWTNQSRPEHMFLMLNMSLISVAVRAPFTSCLLASSTSGRPRSSSLFSVYSSSLRASSRRSRPELSTTNTTAAASWWKLGQCSRILLWPPTSHTVRAVFFPFFFASSISTLKPMVGTVVTHALSFSL